MNVRDVIGLLISTGVLDVKTGKVDADKLRGRWSIEDRGRRGVKITREAGADDNKGGNQRGGNG